MNDFNTQMQTIQYLYRNVDWMSVWLALSIFTFSVCLIKCYIEKKVVKVKDVFFAIAVSAMWLAAILYLAGVAGLVIVTLFERISTTKIMDFPLLERKYYNPYSITNQIVREFLPITAILVGCVFLGMVITEYRYTTGLAAVVFVMLLIYAVRRKYFVLKASIDEEPTSEMIPPLLKAKPVKTNVRTFKPKVRK